MKNHDFHENHDLPEMKILEIRQLLRASTGKIFTSEHKNYAGINRTHRELHFLSSLATQLAKLATGELGEIGKISKKNSKYHENQGF